MHDVVVYSRQGCHLCDVVKETLRKLQDKADYRWREVDIDADRELQQKYNDEVPVVLINGRKAFKYQMSARDFLRVLARESSQRFLAVLRMGPNRMIRELTIYLRGSGFQFLVATRFLNSYQQEA